MGPEYGQITRMGPVLHKWAPTTFSPSAPFLYLYESIYIATTNSYSTVSLFPFFLAGSAAIFNAEVAR